MTVVAAKGIVRLSGRCMAEDAELLLKQLAAGVTQVDLTDCEYLHGAIVQLLMATRPALVGEPAEFLRDWVIPLIRGPDSP
jgi:hypothetical protein